MLLEREQVEVQLVPVELDVVVQGVESHELRSRAGCEPRCALPLKERQVAETPVLPERQRDDRGRDACDEVRGAGDPAAVEETEHEAAQERRACGLDRDRDTGGQAGGERLDGVRALQHAQAEVDGHEDEDHRRKVGHRRQSESLRQCQLGVALVVEVVSELDADERDGEPQRDGPVREDLAADSLCDAVDAEQRDRPEHEHVEEDDPRQRRNEGWSAERGNRSEQRGPAAADERRRDLSVDEQPAADVVPELIATLVEKPAVVSHRERERERREPLDGDCGDEQPCRAHILQPGADSRERLPGATARLDGVRRHSAAASVIGTRTGLE